MATDLERSSRDWLGSVRSHALAWRVPKIAIIGGLLAPVTVRTGIWVVALAWMGTACILNARRCGRTHCRYTGPYYLMMIVPVAWLGFGGVAADIYTWLLLACVILLGSKLIWWATERAWGKFS
jgi:hypothetical protein